MQPASIEDKEEFDDIQQNQLCSTLQNIEKTDPDLFLKIKKYLQMLARVILQQRREVQDAKLVQLCHNFAALEKFIAQDQKIKDNIDQINLEEIENIVKYLNVGTALILSTLLLLNSPAEILLPLKESCNSYFQASKRRNLHFLYFVYYSHLSLSFIYVNSLAFIGAELIWRIARTCFHDLQKTKWPLYCKLVGAILGLWYTFSSSYYSLAKLFITQTLTISITQATSKKNKDNGQRFFQLLQNLLSPANIVMAIRFFWNLVETLVTYNPQYFIQGTLDLAGSFAAGKLFDYAISPSKNKKLSADEITDRIMGAWIFAVLGYQLGNDCGAYGWFIWQNITNKLYDRDEAIQNLYLLEEKYLIKNLKINFSSLYWPSALWYNNKNPIQISISKNNCGLSSDLCQDSRDCQIYTTSREIFVDCPPNENSFHSEADSTSLVLR